MIKTWLQIKIPVGRHDCHRQSCETLLPEPLAVRYFVCLQWSHCSCCFFLEIAKMDGMINVLQKKQNSSTAVLPNWIQKKEFQIDIWLLHYIIWLYLYIYIYVYNSSKKRHPTCSYLDRQKEGCEWMCCVIKGADSTPSLRVPTAPKLEDAGKTFISNFLPYPGGWTNPFEKYLRQIGSFPQGWNFPK